MFSHFQYIIVLFFKLSYTAVLPYETNVHTPWCVDCEAISKNVEKLAKHFSGLDNLKFARIDASVNEHSKLQVNNYPTLFLYPAEDKSKPIKLSKKSSVKDLVKLIKEKLQISDVETVAAAADSVKDEL
uniref:Pdi5 n=1 Tax=Arundo donax TaxID=35708 RepID=A0A0A9EZY1_ARUDO